MTIEDVKQKLQALATECRLDDLTTTEGRSSEYVRGCGREILEWFNTFNDILLKNIRVFDQGRKAVLLTVCSYAKPYSNSFIHYGIRKALFEAGLLDQIEYWHLSSAGVIPSCLEEEVPYCCYDWNNEHALESDLVALRAYLKDHYLHWLKAYAAPLGKRVVTYFREESNTRIAMDRTRTAGVGNVRLKNWSDHLHQQDLVTLGGTYTDPDCMLLDHANLARMTSALRTRCGV